MLGKRGRPMLTVAAQMRRDQLAAMEDLHRLHRDARLHLFAQQPERHRVEVLLDLDVVVEADPATFPVRVFVWRRWQRLQRGPVDLFVERASGGAPAAHRPVVQVVDEFADRLVQFIERKEPAVPQPRQNPALHDLNTDLDLCLVARLVWTRRHDRGAVVRRHVGVGAIDQRLVEAGARDPGLQVVADDLPRHAAEERQQVHMYSDPVRQRLAPDRLGVDETGGAQDRDEDLRAAYLPGRPIEHLHGVPGEVDEQLLPSQMHLAQRRLQSSNPGPIEIAEPGVTEPVRSTGAVFFPKQRQGHVWSAELAMNRCPVRRRPLVHGHIRRRRIQQRLEPFIIDIIRQRPAQAGQSSPTQIAADRSLAEPQALRDGPLRQSVAQSQSQYFAYLPHRQSFARHSRSPASRQRAEPTFG